MKATEINFVAECVNQIVHGIKNNNADLKAFSVPAHVNPGLENCINRLIMQYFCTCIIPFVMLKMHSGRGSAGMGGGESRCVVGQSKGSWICREFHCPIMYIHLDACVSVGARMCQHPFLMFLFVRFLAERPGETYFSILES